jgi:hypothetical protein
MLMGDCPCGLDHVQRINHLTRALIDVLNAARPTPCETVSALAMARVNAFLSVPAEHHADMMAVELDIALRASAGELLPARRRYDA